MSAFDYSIAYHINSDLSDDSPKKYINCIEAKIFVNSLSGKTLQVGRVFLKIVLLTQARKNKYNFQNIFNSYQATKNLARNVLCIPLNDFDAPLTINCSSSDFKTDICLIESIELLPSFRGKGVGKTIISDIIHRFGPMCSAFFVQAVPFQLKVMRNLVDEMDEFTNQMQYTDAQFDEESAQFKLYAFFQKSSFDLLNDGYFVLENHPIIEL